MLKVKDVVNSLFDEITSVLVAPVGAIVEQDKQVCIQHVRADTPIKIVLGRIGEFSGRILYTEPSPAISNELISRLNTIREKVEKIYYEGEDEYARIYSFPVKLPTGNVINIKSRTLDYAIVIYALPNVVIGRFDITFREKNIINRLTIDTTYPTVNPDAIASRVVIFSAGTKRSTELFKRIMSELSGILDGFSSDVYELISSEKLKIPEDEVAEVTRMINGDNSTQIGNDPSFF